MCPVYLFPFLEIQWQYTACFLPGKSESRKRKIIRSSIIFWLKNMSCKIGKTAVGKAMGIFRK